MPRDRQERLGLTTLEDISTLILHSHDLDETLDNIVELVAKRMGTEVCSIYLIEDDQETLRLRATRGLSPNAVGKVSMKVSEGLTGLAVEKRQVIAIEEPASHPRYRYFEETHEERFHSFLGIPLFDRRTPIGALSIQTVDPRRFTPAEISTLSTIAFQISAIVVNARLLDSIRQKEQGADRLLQQLAQSGIDIQQQESPPEAQESNLQGVVAYSGVTIGPVHLLDKRLGFPDLFEETDIEIEPELEKLEEALEKTRIQTLFLERRVAERLSEDDAAIFHTHLMILEDRGFLDKLETEIELGHSAAFALKKVVGQYLEAFERIEDHYLRERAADMRDIGHRLLANLTGQNHASQTLRYEGILVAREILPSDMAVLDHTKITGIVTETEETNSHAVIMAKSLGIPALVGVKGALKAIAPEDSLILDANSGHLYINPPEDIQEEYRRLEQDAQQERTLLQGYRDLPALTGDGTRVTLRANIGLISDIDIALRNGAEGVGLYRTEFPYMARGTFPNREDQYQLYSRVVEGFGGQPVTIRTLDIGGDKGLPYFAPPHEPNPFMGWRSVRVSLDNRDIFQTQIEAILMAAAHGPVKLLFPLISGLDELIACREVVEAAKANLVREGIDHAERVPIGIMIEVPAAVQMAPLLAREVDFFALGTNDLTQYLLAADRNNPLVKKYYDPLHPALLHALRQVIEAGTAAGRDLCLCGEMATDPGHFLALLGLGVREFSMPAPFIPRIKAFMQKLSATGARQVAGEILGMGESAAIRRRIEQALTELN